MADTKLYSPLLALVDNHLSKTSLKGTAVNGFATIKISPINGLRNSSASESASPLLCQQRFPIPELSTNETHIHNVLAKQVVNMLRAKEKRQQEEDKQKLADEMRRLQIEEEKNSVIDLVKAIQTPIKPDTLPQYKKVLSSCSSMDSLFEPDFTDSDGEPERTIKKEPLLPCITDLDTIKMNRAKCSAFGKVLSSRVRPIAAPYFKETIPTNIVRFDFNSPSPCDLIKAQSQKRTMSN